MSDTSNNNSKCKGESFTSGSRLSAFAPPFNLKTHDQEPSFNPFSLENRNLEVVYDYNYGCYVPYDDPFQNETNSFHFQYPLKSEVNLLDSDAKLANLFSQATAAAAASMSYNSFLEPDENKLSYSPEYNSSQAQEIRPLGANTTLLPHKLGLSENVDSYGDDAVIMEKYSDRNLSAIKEPHGLLNTKDKMTCQENTPIDKGKEKQNVENVVEEAIDTMDVAKTELSPDAPDDVSFKSRNTESGAPVQNSSVTLDENDSDVDSPCWKGTGVHQSPFHIPGTVSSELPKVETRRSLNPMAPDFFPGGAKPFVEHLENKCGEEDSSLKKAASSVVLLSKECRLTDYVKAGTCPSEVRNIIVTQFSGDIHDAGNKYSLPNKSNRSSVLNSLFVDGPCPMGERHTSGGQGLTAKVSGSVDNVKPCVFNGSTHVSPPATGNPLTSVFSRNGVSSDFCETLQGASKSAPPKLDVQLVINTMHDLSELLRWNYSNDLDPINDHEHDMIQHTIDNLSVCITNKVQQRVSISESGHPSTSYCPKKLTDCQKIMSMKPVAVADDWERRKSLPAKFSRKVMASSSRTNKCIKKGEEVTQVIGNTWKENHQIVIETHRPLLNENLQLESEASPRSFPQMC